MTTEMFTLEMSTLLTRLEEAQKGMRRAAKAGGIILTVFPIEVALFPLSNLNGLVKSYVMDTHEYIADIWACLHTTNVGLAPYLMPVTALPDDSDYVQWFGELSACMQEMNAAVVKETARITGMEDPVIDMKRKMAQHKSEEVKID